MKINFEKIAIEKGYYVTNCGKVFSKKGKERKTDIKGLYYRFSINIKGKIKKIYVHKLQAYQKFGNDMKKRNLVVRHLNSDSFDNSYDNIELGTQLQNMKDKLNKNINTEDLPF